MDMTFPGLIIRSNLLEGHLNKNIEFFALYVILFLNLATFYPGPCDRPYARIRKLGMIELSKN